MQKGQRTAIIGNTIVLIVPLSFIINISKHSRTKTFPPAAVAKLQLREWRATLLRHSYTNININITVSAGTTYLKTFTRKVRNDLPWNNNKAKSAKWKWKGKSEELLLLHAFALSIKNQLKRKSHGSDRNEEDAKK